MVLVTVTVAILARDEQAVIERAIWSASRVADHVLVVDTGSTDDTPQIAQLAGARVLHRPWKDFGTARTEAIHLARGMADWTLLLDADMTVEPHPELRGWLAADPDPEVAAWRVEITEADIRYRLPLLTRNTLEWRYTGATHEFLEGEGRKQRDLLGLTVHHHVDGANRERKHERDLELLAEGVVNEDPRSVYYTAQALKCLGRTEDAARMYELRSHLGGWEEERWHAQYMAARLKESVPDLMDAFLKRPHRHEPLSAAANILKQRDHDDSLFLEV